MDYKLCRIGYQKRNIQNCCCHRHGRMYSLFRIYHRPVDLSAKATAQNNGRNQIMVFTIHGNIGAYHLLEMEIQMDTLLLHFGIDSVLHHQHTQTGDTRPVADACTPKCVVHSSCDSIHVFILSAWMRIHNRMYRNEKA